MPLCLSDIILCWYRGVTDNWLCIINGFDISCFVARKLMFHQLCMYTFDQPALPFSFSFEDVITTVECRLVCLAGSTDAVTNIYCLRVTVVWVITSHWKPWADKYTIFTYHHLTVVLLHWKRGLPRKCAQVLLCPIKISYFCNHSVVFWDLIFDHVGKQCELNAREEGKWTCMYNTSL